VGAGSVTRPSAARFDRPDLIGVPVTESTSAVEQAVQQRIQAARIRVAAAQQRRDELSAARRRGLAARHANKLRNLAEQEQRATEQPDDEPEETL
jgi:hypothetical protein